MAGYVLAMRGETGQIRAGTAAGRWVLAGAILASSIAFLDGTVVNVALPAIGDDLGGGIGGQQWIVNAYLVPLAALILVGGALGDRYGRVRVVVIGTIVFGLASVACGLAPTIGALTIARAVQGVGGALLTPGTLAIVSASFAAEDRGRAVGTWSGFTAISGAAGPFVGGWLIDAIGWRAIFFVNVPLVVVAVAVLVGRVPESSDPDAVGGIDATGAALVTVGLATLSYGLIESQAAWTVVGVVALVAFVLVEGRVRHPMMPLWLYRSQRFNGANALTFAVYAALGASSFFLVQQLQRSLGYSALESGAAALPVTAIIFVLSPRVGARVDRIGPLVPLVVGPLVLAAGFALLAGVSDGDRYVTAVLPGVVLQGLALSLIISPLVAVVMGSAGNANAGIASGVNNATARTATLVAIAILPALVGFDPEGAPDELSGAYRSAMTVIVGLCIVGAAIAALTMRGEHAR